MTTLTRPRHVYRGFALVGLVLALVAGTAGGGTAGTGTATGGATHPVTSNGTRPATSNAAAPSAPLPVTPAGKHVDTFHGTQVPDPYRHLEDTSAAGVAAWMKAHADNARSTLDAIGARTALLDSLRRFDEATPGRVTGAVRTPSGLWFYEKRAAGAEQFALYVRQGLNGVERRLVDTDALSARDGQPHAINWFVPSPNGRYVAYGLSAGGSEDAVLHLLDVRTGKPVGKPLDRAQFGGVSWDGEQALYFNRLQGDRAQPTPTLDRYQRSAVYRLTVGAAAPVAVPLLGPDTPGVTIEPAEIPFVSITHDGRWALGTAINGVQREIKFYVAPAASLRTGRPAWRQLIDTRDAVTQVDYFDGTLYLLSHRGAPRSRLLALDIRASGMDQAQERIAPSDRVLTGLGAARDALYVEAREGNVKKLLRLPYGSDTPTPIALPVDGSFSLGSEGGGSATDGRLAGAVIELQGWQQARQIWAVQPDGIVVNTGLQPAGPFDAPTDIVTREVLVTSHDGQQVPLSIIHRRDTPLDGNRPTLLYGYASYGETEEPHYSTLRFAWLQAGGVYAVANPRGSGVFGEQWYKAGFQATKPNTWRDFIACAQALISGGYTRPARLGIMGGSAGGILVGRAMTERPDLFAAVIASVGALDMVRSEDTPNGVPNIPEFGSRRTEAGFQALLGMSTYHQIKDQVAYPAVMFTHGVNDPRVEVWNSTKTAARLMAATSSGRPVLLRLDFDAGHGIGNTRRQVETERADIIAFLLWQMGEPGYELRR